MKIRIYKNSKHWWHMVYLLFTGGNVSVIEYTMNKPRYARYLFRGSCLVIVLVILVIAYVIKLLIGG